MGGNGRRLHEEAGENGHADVTDPIHEVLARTPDEHLRTLLPNHVRHRLNRFATPWNSRDGSGHPSPKTQKNRRTCEKKAIEDVAKSSLPLPSAEPARTCLEPEFVHVEGGGHEARSRKVAMSTNAVVWPFPRIDLRRASNNRNVHGHK